jgi:hypothetical protein
VVRPDATGTDEPVLPPPPPPIDAEDAGAPSGETGPPPPPAAMMDAAPDRDPPVVPLVPTWTGLDANDSAPEVPDALVPDVAPDMAGKDDGAPDGTLPGDVPPEVLSPPDAMPDLAPEAATPIDGPLPCPGAGCPNFPAAAHLQLWLRGDQAVDCVPQGTENRVSAWQDLSGKGHHARTPANVRGPLCGPGATMINGRRTVTFPRTAGATAEEYLEVDLTSLINTSFTIAVVERRAGADRTSYVLGSKLPVPDSVGCTSNPNAGAGILLGYERSTMLIGGTWGPDCGARVPVDAFGPKPNTTVLIFSPGVGATLYADGVASPTAATPKLDTLTALIGRGFDAQMPENRYHGDLAELIAFDTALSDVERVALENYLHGFWDPTP